MINVSNAYKSKISDGFPVAEEVDIVFANGVSKTVRDEILNADNEIADGIDGNSFPIGATVCKTCGLALDNSSEQWKDYDFFGAKLKVRLKMTLDDGTVETINKGTYTVTVPEEYGEDVELTALDDMYKANKTYTTNLQFPQTAFSVLRDACQTCDISLGVTSMEHGDIQITAIPEGVTFRVVIGCIAMLESANARVDVDGYLQFVKWDFAKIENTTEDSAVADNDEFLKFSSGADIDDDGFASPIGDWLVDSDGYLQSANSGFSEAENSATVDGDNFLSFGGGDIVDSDGFISPIGDWAVDSNGFLYLSESMDAATRLRDYVKSPTLSTDDIVITGIRVKSGDTSYLYGVDGYVIELENNLLKSDQIQTVASWIGDNLIGVRFRSMEGELLYNPLIEFGDMARTYDRKGNSHITPITYAASPLNGKTTLKTQAESPIRGTSQYYSEATKTYVKAHQLFEKEKTDRELAIEKLKESLSVGSGLFATYVQQEDGSTISYFHDKSTLEESKNVIKITSEAIGVSNDGGKTYPFGFVLTGTMITKLLYAEGINADYIDSGALAIKDKSGNIIFQADIDNKTVRISGDCVMIGDKTVTKAIKDVENSVAEGKNMNVYLSNEYQGIPVNSAGEITGNFPEVKTVLTVYYGTTDVTNDCSYSIQKSDAVMGNWNTSTHTYTVTGLSGDSGWIDIRVTYLQTLSVTKRFTVSKLYGGQAGRYYVLEPSCNILKRDFAKTISPNVLGFNAYYVDGDTAKRMPYKGRMVIEETSDGEAWTTVYTSETDEDAVTHYLHTVLTDNSGRTITDGNGTTLGIPRDITNIRCKLYAAGGTTDMLDMQSVAVVLDVESLTAEQIVNILTNNGEWKGLYYLNGHLYLSFDAALGGILTLGGKSNGDGRIIMRRSDGTPYGSIDNDGITFFKHYTEDDNGYEYEGYRITKDGVRKASGYKSADPSMPDIEFVEDEEVLGNDTIIDFGKLERNRSMVLIKSSTVTMFVSDIDTKATATVSTTFERLSDVNECVAIYAGITAPMLNCYNYKISKDELIANFVNYDDITSWNGTATFQILQYSYIGGN